MWFLTPLFILISLKVIKRKQRCFSKEIDFYKNLMAKGSELIISDSSNGEGGALQILRRCLLSYLPFGEE